LASKRDQVETLLALGATRWEAGRWAVEQPSASACLNYQYDEIAGLVSLPGMMTGQIIAGQDPSQAAPTRSCIMFLIAAGTAMGTFSVCAWLSAGFSRPTISSSPTGCVRCI